MIRLLTKTLDANTQKTLADLQAQINAETTFEQQAAKAKALWNAKSSGLTKAAFETIKSELFDLCVFTGVCNYCEQNEAGDIEHIYPKSFFPEHAFVWDNYLLACKTCNSGFKLDKCYVINATDNSVTKTERGNKPPHNEIAFINPRTENPNDFMVLNPYTHRFEIIISTEEDKKSFNKANYTLRILELNERDVLVAARKSAANHYYDCLERIVRISNSKTIEELQEVLRPNEGRFDFTRPLEHIKNEIKESYRAYIQNYQHPSVWYAIKTVLYKTEDRNWKKLFDQIPEALNW